MNTDPLGALIDSTELIGVSAVTVLSKFGVAAGVWNPELGVPAVPPSEGGNLLLDRLRLPCVEAEVCERLLLVFIVG